MKITRPIVNQIIKEELSRDNHSVENLTEEEKRFVSHMKRRMKVANKEQQKHLTEIINSIESGIYKTIIKEWREILKEE